MTYIPVTPQDSLGETWIEAVRTVCGKPGWEAYNVILGVKAPNSQQLVQSDLFRAVDAFLIKRAKPLNTVANTIFPADLYYLNRSKGLDQFFSRFQDKVLPMVRKDRRWSGYYFERMTHVERLDGSSFNPLRDVIKRINDVDNHSRSKFEISTFDPARDVTGSPYGGQCLSHLSFKLAPKEDGKGSCLNLTATYRNHYYIEKLLGNLLGLTRLMEFVSVETGIQVGGLTVVSTKANVDLPGKSPKKAKKSDILGLMSSLA